MRRVINILYTRKSGNRSQNKQQVYRPSIFTKLFKGKYTHRKIQKYFELVGRVNVRIFDQSGKLLVKVDSIVPSDQNIYAVDDGTGDKVFKRAHATLCAVVSDSNGRPHIHIVSDTNAKQSIMETNSLNIFNPIRYYGSNFEFVDNPIYHNSSAKLILFDATIKGHSMQEVIAAIMKNDKHSNNTY